MFGYKFQSLFRRVRDGAKGERSETFHDVRATCPPLAEPAGDDRRESEQRVNTPPLGAD